MESKYALPSEPMVMEITPDIAGDWLDNRNHPNNRKLSMTVSARYAADMAAGRWKLTPESLIFDTDGLIISAQHRLQGVRNSRMTLPFWVTPNQPRDIFDVVDQGWKRTAAQALQVTNATSVAAGARYIATLDETTRFGRFSRVTNPEIVSVVRAWPELTWNTTAIINVRARACIPPGPHVAVLAQAQRSAYRSFVPSWLDGLANGAGLAVDDPRYQLRERFITNRKTLSGTANRDLVYSLIVKAWNAYATNSPVKMLRWLSSESIPDVVDIQAEGRKAA